MAMGSVFKLSGKRRKPFGARITVGWEVSEKTGKAKQKYKSIGYYETRREAMIALAEYNNNPYDLDSKKITFAEMYELFLKEKFPNEILTDSEKNNKKAYVMAYKHSDALHKMKFTEVRKSHMQDAIDNCPKGHSTKKKIKLLFGQMYKFAMENDVVEKDYSSFVSVPENTEATSRKPFTQKQIDFLWENVNKYDFIDAVLIMIYSGMRPGELILIKNEDINLEERYMRGGIKTKAGKNRVIPIHKKIHSLIENRMDDNNEYLYVNSKGTKMIYATFLKHNWTPLMKELKISHRPHDCRHTFATMMDNSGANKLSIKKIMGHASTDITDKVYTHKSIEELVKAIDMI